MNKKGLSYVDWAISVGLFLVFLVIIFIVFQPVLVSGDDKEYLVTIVKDGLESSTFASIDIYPVFIDYDLEETIPQIKIERFPEDLSQEIGNTFIVSDAGIKYNFSVTGNTFSVKNVKLENKVNTLFILTSPNILNTQNFFELPEVENSINYSVGINENVFGFYQENFQSEINGKPYSSLKTEWNFPQNRDFQIFIYNASNLTTPILSYNQEEPETFDSVKTLYYSTNLIEIGNQKPIKQNPIFIQIRVW